jgi:hypothetical protein
MAVRKRKKRRARKAHGNPKRKVHRRKKRRAVANPKRSHKRRARRRVRRAVGNPRRRVRAKRRHSSRRRVHANPARRRRSGKRRHRRNPGLPLWAEALLASGLAVAGYAVIHVAATGVTQHTDPSFATLPRNRNIVAGAAVIGGILLAMKKSPIFGAALAASGAVAALGTGLTLKMTNLLPAPKQMSAVYADNLAAVYADNMAGYQSVAGLLPMQAVMSQDMRGIGFVPQAPWENGGSPF